MSDERARRRGAGWLDRLLPHLALEGDLEDQPAKRGRELVTA